MAASGRAGVTSKRFYAEAAKQKDDSTLNVNDDVSLPLWKTMCLLRTICHLLGLVVVGWRLGLKLEMGLFNLKWTRKRSTQGRCYSFFGVADITDNLPAEFNTIGKSSSCYPASFTNEGVRLRTRRWRWFRISVHRIQLFLY